jgi:hypothetical protein
VFAPYASCRQQLDGARQPDDSVTALLMSQFKAEGAVSPAKSSSSSHNKDDVSAAATPQTRQTSTSSATASAAKASKPKPKPKNVKPPKSARRSKTEDEGASAPPMISQAAPNYSCQMVVVCVIEIEEGRQRSQACAVGAGERAPCSSNTTHDADQHEDPTQEWFSRSYSTCSCSADKLKRPLTHSPQSQSQVTPHSQGQERIFSRLLVCKLPRAGAPT